MAYISYDEMVRRMESGFWHLSRQQSPMTGAPLSSQNVPHTEPQVPAPPPIVNGG